ncbi:family 20 glycosylhydrolase [Streptomyces sp. YIM S03343]
MKLRLIAGAAASRPVPLVPEDADADVAARVLGTQARLWAEFVTTPAHIEHLTRPRLCALADHGWSGPTEWAGFHARLDEHTDRPDALDTNHPLILSPSRKPPPSGEEQR